MSLKQLYDIILYHMGSEIAKNGFKEEQLVCDDLNKRLSNIFGHFKRIKGVFKSDVSNNKGINIQVKKFKKNCFGQIDRRSIDSWTNHISELKSIECYLKDICEFPIDTHSNKIDKSHVRKKWNELSYSNEELQYMLCVLNENKENMIDLIFYGDQDQWRPNILCGVEYKHNKRHNMICYKTNDIVKYLQSCRFKIRPSGTVFELGPFISFQRKGGDSGNPSSNQLQTKIVFSKIQHLNIKRMIYLL